MQLNTTILIWDRSVTGSEQDQIREAPLAPLLWVELAQQQRARGCVDVNSMVTLWDLLTAVSFAMPIGGALASAKLARASFGGYVLAITVGLALGLSFALSMRTIGKTVAAQMKGQYAPREWYARALYFAAVLWILLGLFLGNWLSSAAMRLVF
jgi:hypothetical protein